MDRTGLNCHAVFASKPDRLTTLDVAGAGIKLIYAFARILYFGESITAVNVRDIPATHDFP